MDSKKVRKASHAGSWYSDSKDKLDASLNTWLNKTERLNSIKKLRAIIGPHAGFDYSGSTAAFAYINIDPALYSRVFLLGPCHHKYLDGCGLPTCDIYETPLGNLNVDKETIQDLSKIDKFVTVNKKDEEKEHSLEMHLPYIKRIFKDRDDIKLVPIMVGNLDANTEKYFGNIFSKYIEDENNLFIVSSDFCHWGDNFDFKYYDKKDGEIYQSIEKLDKQGIEFIEQQNPEKFEEYIKATDNTICGRHPIAVLLNALKASKLETSTKLVYYKQSNQVKNKNDMSVSYASIVTYI